nr:hypothetical protein [Flavobacterium covae]
MPSEEEMKAKYLVTNQINFIQAIPGSNQRIIQPDKIQNKRIQIIIIT